MSESVNLSNLTPTSQLPLLSKHLVICSYIASHNHAKHDRRLFSHSYQQNTSKRKGALPTVQKVRHSLTLTDLDKVAQTFAGPKMFPLERLLAILRTIFETDPAYTVEVYTQVHHTLIGI